MALINCPECGKEVSEFAKACPHCGYPVLEMYTQSKAYRQSFKLRKQDVVELGTYPPGERTPIEWIVLDTKDDAYLLLSKYVLDCHQYGYNRKWVDSEIRRWLNDDFLNRAFSEEEQNLIKNNGTNKEANDKVFLLNCEEFRKYTEGLLSVKECKGIPYSYAQGVYDRKGLCHWMLRRDENSKEYIAFVGSMGNCFEDESYRQDSIRTSSEHAAVRPAIWVKRDK